MKMHMRVGEISERRKKFNFWGGVVMLAGWLAFATYAFWPVA